MDLKCTNAPSEFCIAPFRFDITPPLGHPLLGGLVMPAIGHDDSLEGLGYVLLGTGRPIVVCALDWAGLMNDAHIEWRTMLAAAAGTTADRVTIHCVHQHATPFVCPGAREAALKAPDLPAVYDPVFVDLCLRRAQAAMQAALERPERVTHVAHGQGEVREVAANRRIARDAAGRVTAMRGSSCTDPQLRALPEGTIDPMLQTVAFYSEARKVLACHYYATHPMSYYRDGCVSSDFCGLARKQRQQDERQCLHIYFSGCAGNVTAGKYNDGSPANRGVLVRRMYAGLVASEAKLDPQPLRAVDWRTACVLPPASRALDAATIEAGILAADRDVVDRLLLAFRLAWLRRVEGGAPLVLSRLRLNDISILHLPAEMFIEYQLRAQAMRPGQPVAVAAYGDGGPWYMPTREEFGAGGYEASVAFCAEEADETFTAAIRQLLA